MCTHLVYVSEKHMPIRRDKMTCMGIINTIFKIKALWVFSTMLITFHLFISIVDTCIILCTFCTSTLFHDLFSQNKGPKLFAFSLLPLLLYKMSLGPPCQARSSIG